MTYSATALGNIVQFLESFEGVGKLFSNYSLLQHEFPKTLLKS